MNCGKCGKEVRPGDAFCPQCGRELGEGIPWGEVEAREPGAEEAGPGAGTTTPLVPPATPPSAPVPPVTGVKRKTSGMAVASLVLGILGITCLPFVGSVLAIVFGAVAKREIKRSEVELGGSGVATAGLVLGIVMIGLLLISSAVFVPLALVSIGPTRTVSRTVDLEGAKTVEAELKMSSGELDVRGGAGSLLEGAFTYNVKKWEPDVEYEVTGGEGKLSVTQPWSWVPSFGGTRNQWNIRLNDEVPIDLTVRTSSAGSELDLGDLSLLGLDVDSSSGSLSADLSGKMPSLRTVQAHVSSGNMTLSMRGEYSSPIKLDAGGSSGNATIDLSGEWKADLEAEIKVSSGNITLRLPRDAGVYVEAKTSSGSIDASGMKLKGDAYVNDAYRTSKITLRINVKTSSGNINLMPGI